MVLSRTGPYLRWSTKSPCRFRDASWSLASGNQSHTLDMAGCQRFSIDLCQNWPNCLSLSQQLQLGDLHRALKILPQTRLKKKNMMKAMKLTPQNNVYTFYVPLKCFHGLPKGSVNPNLTSALKEKVTTLHGSLGGIWDPLLWRCLEIPDTSYGGLGGETLSPGYP